ncbi:MAG: ABC transporter substrate-binding protein, partial [Planctomycetaceae bacterium]|nr:ABC transporter substrate-binding protein [Planctomycetaceae bacterium]
ELERLGLPVVALTADSFAGLCEELQLLGRITGHEDQATHLVRRFQERIDRVRQTARGIPTAERVTVFYQAWGEPLTAAGPTSYLGEMIQLCGGLNIIDDATTRYPKISLEVLVSRNPDVIVSSTNHANSFSEDSLQSRPGWSDLQAVRHKRIHLLDGDLVSRCSPRLVDALELMAHALYPAHFAAPHAESTTNGKQP